MELIRRILFLILIMTAVWFFMTPSLTPLVLVETVDFAKQQKKEGSYMGVRIMTDAKKRLRDMPPEAYIDEKTRGRIHRVTGPEWDALFFHLSAINSGKTAEKAWSRRMPSDQHPMKVFYYRPGEGPVKDLAGSFTGNNDSLYAVLSSSEGSGQRAYLKMTYRAYSDDDFHFGSGFSRYPTPPTSMLYPYRLLSIILASLAVLIYVFPRRKAGPPGTIRYPSWRILMCDIVSVILIVPFFAFPFFIIGGSVQAFTVGWPLLFFFWPIAILGVWSLVIAAWFASFSLRITGDHLEIGSYKGMRSAYYRDMAFFQPCIFRAPRWLVILSWAAALMGTGAAGIGATGRALIVTGAEAGCIGISMNDGTTVYISITDQMGTAMVKGDTILKALRQGGVEEKTEAKVVRSMGLEMIR